MIKRHSTRHLGVIVCVVGLWSGRGLQLMWPCVGATVLSPSCRCPRSALHHLPSHSFRCCCRPSSATTAIIPAHHTLPPTTPAPSSHPMWFHPCASPPTRASACCIPSAALYNHPKSKGLLESGWVGGGGSTLVPFFVPVQDGSCCRKGCGTRVCCLFLRLPPTHRATRGVWRVVCTDLDLHHVPYPERRPLVSDVGWLGHLVVEGPMGNIDGL